ncbi:MAG: GTP 3',8-cyclase MoaA [Myxococcales bacterium]|nr:GTP 3',8-cyclase MoaA [Myxococcales bacterium]
MVHRRLQLVDAEAPPRMAPPMPQGFAPDGTAPPLRDAQGRSYRYLRISVIDRCDFACVYCMPHGGEEDHAPRSDMLTFEEIASLVGVFSSIGTERVRLTGGEPLVRKGIVDLVAQVRQSAPGVHVAMTSNASRLAHFARPLRDAGLGSINISIDSLDPDRFARLTRGGRLQDVLAGIDAAIDVGLEVKLNTVAMRGENDEEFAKLVDFAWDRGITPRFIELMPIGEGARLPFGAYISAKEIAAKLGPRIMFAINDADGPVGPARYAQSQKDPSKHRVGFITAISESFCHNCNRVRITSSGEIRACIASRQAVSLRELIRQHHSATGASKLTPRDKLEVAWSIHWALRSKEAGHFFLAPEHGDHQDVAMSAIGG